MRAVPRRLLLVEDESPVRLALGDALRGSGYDVVEAANGVSALNRLTGAARTAIDVVVTDIRMPDMGGLELLRVLRERGSTVDIVMMTAFDDMSTVVEAMKYGAAEFLVKPIDLDQLLRVLDRIFVDRALLTRQEAEGVPASGSTLVGRDPKMIELFKLVGQCFVVKCVTHCFRGRPSKSER